MIIAGHLSLQSGSALFQVTVGRASSSTITTQWASRLLPTERTVFINDLDDLLHDLVFSHVGCGCSHPGERLVQPFFSSASMTVTRSSNT